MMQQLVCTSMQMGDAALKSNDVAGVQSDSLGLKKMPVGFMLKTTGDIKFVTYDNETITFTSCPAGVIFPVMLRQIYDTGTSVANTEIVLFYSKH